MNAWVFLAGLRMAVNLFHYCFASVTDDGSGRTIVLYSAQPKHDNITITDPRDVSTLLKVFDQHSLLPRPIPATAPAAPTEQIEETSAAAPEPKVEEPAKADPPAAVSDAPPQAPPPSEPPPKAAEQATAEPAAPVVEQAAADPEPKVEEPAKADPPASASPAATKPTTKPGGSPFIR